MQILLTQSRVTYNRDAMQGHQEATQMHGTKVTPTQKSGALTMASCVIVTAHITMLYRAYPLILATVIKFPLPLKSVYM